MQSAMRISARQSAFLAAPVVAAPRRLAFAPVKLATVIVEAGTGGKLKTRKSASKRLKVTGSGKVMARGAGKQHFNEKMSRDAIRESSKMFTVSSANIPNAKKCLPNSGIKGGH
ncbi:plastid ribosomal protein L35 [Haematococcus lacustris]